MRMNDNVDLSHRDRWMWVDSGRSFGWDFSPKFSSSSYEVFKWREFGYEPPLWLILKKEREVERQYLRTVTGHLKYQSRNGVRCDCSWCRNYKLTPSNEVTSESVDQETHHSTRSLESFSHDECIVLPDQEFPLGIPS